MNLKEIKAYYNKTPVTYVIKRDKLLLEDNAYVPRFNLKNVKEIADLPINEPLKPTPEIILKGIKYGLIFNINYKGAKNKHFAGSERTALFLVYGKSSVGKLLLRGYHLNGFSVSSNRHVTKIFRMFRLDRILSITFTGSFYRLPPTGYQMDDKGMRGGIIAKADFNIIRKNQQDLIKSNQIQNKDEISLEEDDKSLVTIKVKSTDTKLDLNTPLENAYVNNMKDIANVRITFLKSIYGTSYKAIIGALGSPGNMVSVRDESNKNLGMYRVLDSISGETLKKIKRIKGNAVFDVFLFDKKL
jgi:hypothetical protein